MSKKRLQAHIFPTLIDLKNEGGFVLNKKPHPYRSC